jgi:hypothetical protein
MTWLRARGLWIRRALAVIAGWMLLMFVRVQSAAAAPIVAADKIGQTPPALAWIDLKDSRGISIWNFEMSLDRGGITSPDKFFWASITDACWGAYRSWCALSLWFLDWVLSFTWVQTIAAPLLSVGDAMQQVVTRLGLVPTFLTLTALLAGLWMLKGRHTTAVWEVGIACVIAALASGVFAQPVQMIAGQNGYIVKANQTGQELAAALATGDASGKSPEQLRQAQTGQLVDTFIRQPTQMINFGQVLDGGKCEGAYNDVVKGGPYGNESDIRDKISDCDDTLGEYAANPSASMALGSIVFFPAAFVILAMCMLLGGSVIAAAVWAMFQSLKAIVTFVTGLLPGGGRGSLMLTAAETIVALLLIVFTSVFLSVFLLVIQALFAASKGESIPKTFVIVDILIIVGIFVYMRQRKQLKAAAQRLAQWMSQRPGGAPATRLPERAPGIGLGAASTAVRTATGLAQLRAQRAAANREAGPTFVDNRQQAAVFFPFPRRNDGGNGPLPHVDVVPTPAPRRGRVRSTAAARRTRSPTAAPGRPRPAPFACPQWRPTPDPGAQEGRRGPRARGHPRRPGVCHRWSLDRGDRCSTRRQRRQDRPPSGSGRPDDAQRQPSPADADADQAGTPARSPAAPLGPGDPGRGHLLEFDLLDLPVRPATQHPGADPAAAHRQGRPRTDRQEHSAPGQEARAPAACPARRAGGRATSGEAAIPAEHARCSAAVRERPARRPAAPAAG